MSKPRVLRKFSGNGQEFRVVATEPPTIECRQDGAWWTLAGFDDGDQLVVAAEIACLASEREALAARVKEMEALVKYARCRSSCRRNSAFAGPGEPCSCGFLAARLALGPILPPSPGPAKVEEKKAQPPAHSIGGTTWGDCDRPEDKP